jgi:hypothetical protein
MGAAAATVATGGMVGKLFAQATDLVVLGVRAGPAPTTNDVPEIGTTDADTGGASTLASATSVPLLIQSLDTTTGRLQSVTALQFLPDGTPVLSSDELVSGFTLLVDGTAVVAITPVDAGGPTRLIVLSTPPRALAVAGLKKDEQLSSVVGTSDGGLFGLVMKKNGTPPVVLASVDPVTGALSTTQKVSLPATQRFGALAQYPDGTFYTTAVAQDGTTSLAHIDLSQKKATVGAQLHAGSVTWNNGVESLACSSAGQLLALGALRYVTPNSVYTVDIQSAGMTALRSFDVAKMSLSH